MCQEGNTMTFYTESLAAQVAVTTVFSVLVLIGVVGNILACVVITTNRVMRTPMNYLLLNLAVADIIVVVFVAPRFILIHAFSHPHGLEGSIVCKLLTGGNFSWFGGSASVFSLVAIAVERYFAIVHPHSTRGKLTMKKVKIVVIICWAFVVVLNLPLFLTIHYNEEIDFCMEYWPQPWMPKAYSTIWMATTGVIPIAIMFALYTRVIRHLWFNSHNTTQAVVLKSRKRVTKMVIAVSAIYTITWFPVLILYMLNYYHPQQSYGNVTYVIGIVIVTFNSTVNPFVYAFVNERFRSHIRRLFELPCQRQNRVQLEQRLATESTSQQARREAFKIREEGAKASHDSNVM